MPRMATPRQPVYADMDGFSLQAAVLVEALGRDRLERLCLGITRPAPANERAQCKASGLVAPKVKTFWLDGTTHLVKPPLGPLRWLVTLVPRPRLHPPMTASRLSISTVGYPVWVQMVRSAHRRPVFRTVPNRTAAVGVDRELEVTAISCRGRKTACWRPIFWISYWSWPHVFHQRAAPRNWALTDPGPWSRLSAPMAWQQHLAADRDYLGTLPKCDPGLMRSDAAAARPGLKALTACVDADPMDTPQISR
jgi:hypothetical protein